MENMMQTPNMEITYTVVDGGAVKEAVTAQLIGLKDVISSRDRKEFLARGTVSRPTLTKYLRGDVKDIDIATDIIAFFSVKANDKINRLRSHGLVAS
jgi:hypothetical protein